MIVSDLLPPAREKVRAAGEEMFAGGNEHDYGD
jgi:hypothetical protein